jgi:hypothetical protein
VDPDSAFKGSSDPDPIRIQGFDDQKQKKKNTAENFSFLFFSSKLQFTYFQATEEAFSPQKRTSSTSKKMKKMFGGLFCPPGSGYGSRDPIESRSTALIIRHRSKLKNREKSGRAFFW